MTALDILDLPTGPVALHRAREADLPELVALLADDVLGREREARELGPYRRAFAAIDRDPAHLLLAARDEAGALLATLQLTLLPSLSRGGSLRLQIESVRVTLPGGYRLLVASNLNRFDELERLFVYGLLACAVTV